MKITTTPVLKPYIAQNALVDWELGSIPICHIPHPSAAIKANQNYYNNTQWLKGYFNYCHRDHIFKERWQKATGSWHDKIIVDIGCGPGNVFANLGGSPRLLIGVDICLNSLKMAEKIGYTPILADAHNLPFIEGFADLVIINGSLHHFEDMDRVLALAGRLVRPHGLLVTDHDAQYTAWNWKGLGMLLYKNRVPLYRLLSLGQFMPQDEHDAMIASEIHHRPGRGVSPELYYRALEPLGFSVKVYPHNHNVGAETLQGKYGQSDLKYRLSQWLSGIDSNSPEGALSLMCIARRDLC